jgi:16S rRNA (uracil1498-N3)-methyltransferase
MEMPALPAPAVSTRRARIADLRIGEFELDPKAHHYLINVLRLQVGACFQAFSGTGEVAEAVLVSGGAAGGQAHIRVNNVRVEQAAAAPLVLVQALPKGPKLEAIVQDATELGTTHILLGCGLRSTVRLAEQKLEQRAERLVRVIEAAARQCGRSSLPELTWLASFEHALSAAADQYQGATKLLLDAQHAAPVAECMAASGASHAARTSVFAVGPEGGFDAREREHAHALGYQSARLGPHTLRTETAAAAALGAYWALHPNALDGKQADVSKLP